MVPGNSIPVATGPAILRPQSVEDVSQYVREYRRLQIVGASTKPAMSASRVEIPRCLMTGLSGIVDHQPSEFLITARAGTRLSEMREVLANHRQYLPFDPPFADQGATIGGTVAAGLSGAGRLRFGGLRDFIVGIRIVDGLGALVTGGGRVVKNAAGYDLPKLMVGSGGLLGAIVDITLKVFPKPTHARTICLKSDALRTAVDIQSKLARSAIDLAAIDLTPDGSLWLRIEGALDSLDTTTARLQALIGHCEGSRPLQVIADGAGVWGPLDNGTFAAVDDRLVRSPIIPSRLMEIDASLEELSVRRRYSVAGNLVWIAWPSPRPIQQLDECLRHLRIGAIVLTGDVPYCRIGVRPSASMTRRVKSALDPTGCFVGN